MSDAEIPREDVDVAPYAITSGPDMLPCPECGQSCKGKAGLGVHRSTKHGVKPQPPKHIPTGRRRGRPPKIRALPTPPPSYDPDWSINDLFDAVVSILWPQPQGTMPIAALPILVRWRDDTQRMLRELEELP